MLTSQCHMISKPQKSHCHIVVTYYTFLSQVLLNCGGKSWWILVGKTHKTHGPRTLVQGQICCRKPMYINQFQLHSGNQTWRTLGKSPISRWFSQLDTSMCKWGFPEMGEPPARWMVYIREHPMKWMMTRGDPVMTKRKPPNGFRFRLSTTIVSKKD